MSTIKRATIYLDANIHRALKLRAAEGDKSISDIVNEALRAALAEDADDLQTFDNRAREKPTDFKAFVKKLRKDGKL